jgi:hypothetical protein
MGDEPDGEVVAEHFSMNAQLLGTAVLATAGSFLLS